jgi:nitroreductase
MAERLPTLSVDEVLTTTRTVRRRLDLERPVSREVVEECLRIGFQAPNGSNLQLYDWVLVDDPALRSAMGDIYRGGLDAQLAASARAERDNTPSPYPDTPAQQRISASVYHLIEHMQDVPVLVVPTLSGRMEGRSIFDQASRWGSVIPTVWNFMLALRSRGLGSAWTTIHLHREEDMADLLGIPYQRVTQVGLFPVAYTVGTDFRPADRSRAEEKIHWNAW